LKKRGAIGEICSWYFDKNGREKTISAGKKMPIYPLGFGLERLKKMTKENLTVIGVVGIMPQRLDAIYAALKGKLINVLISDHITAKKLLEIKEKEY
jgi:DNA-binding transcriptional regulator LsrR (DeoR family)